MKRDRSTSLWCGKDLVGYLVLLPAPPGTIAGKLSPGPAFDAYRDRLERAVLCAKEVDLCEPRLFQEAWQQWRDACDSLDRLGFSFGDPPTPVESFAVDSGWLVEFESALWWDVEHDIAHPAQQPRSGDRK